MGWVNKWSLLLPKPCSSLLWNRLKHYFILSLGHVCWCPCLFICCTRAGEHWLLEVTFPWHTVIPTGIKSNCTSGLTTQALACRTKLGCETLAKVNVMLFKGFNTAHTPVLSSRSKIQKQEQEENGEPSVNLIFFLPKSLVYSAEWY